MHWHPMVTPYVYSTCLPASGLMARICGSCVTRLVATKQSRPRYSAPCLDTYLHICTVGTVRIFPSGSSSSFPARSSHVRAKRGTIKGWTPDATRRLTQFLWSVEPARLTGGGFAVTLTTGGRPYDSLSWAAARRAFVESLRRRGCTRWQWLTEWTAAGRPHLHLAVYGPLDERDLALTWLRICEAHGWDSHWKAQHVEAIFDATGWLKYVAKHSARGVDHYQRQSPPPGWETTGRLWGKGGDWPVCAPFVLPITANESLVYQALLVAWQARRMQSEGVPPAVIQSYRADHASPTTGGAIRGVSGWIPAAESVKLLLAATSPANLTTKELE